MTNFINMTPDTVTIIVPGDRKEKFSFPPSGQVAQVQHGRGGGGIVGEVKINGSLIPLHTVNPLHVAGLPDPQPGTYLIVCKEVAQMVPDRRDVVFPIHPVTDEDGRIIGHAGFGRFPRMRLPEWSNPMPGLLHPGDEMRISRTSDGAGTEATIVATGRGLEAEVKARFTSVYSAHEWAEDAMYRAGQHTYLRRRSS